MYVCVCARRAGKCGSLPHIGSCYGNSGAHPGGLGETRVSPRPTDLIKVLFCCFTGCWKATALSEVDLSIKAAVFGPTVA